MKTEKFLSHGTLKKENENALKKEKEDSDDENQIEEQLKNIDYGYRELATILPEDDCFNKLNKKLDEEAYRGIESNMCIVHSRFAEVRRYY